MCTSSATALRQEVGDTVDDMPTFATDAMLSSLFRDSVPPSSRRVSTLTGVAAPPLYFSRPKLRSDESTLTVNQTAAAGQPNIDDTGVTVPLVDRDAQRRIVVPTLEVDEAESQLKYDAAQVIDSGPVSAFDGSMAYLQFLHVTDSGHNASSSGCTRSLSIAHGAC